MSNMLSGDRHKSVTSPIKLPGFPGQSMAISDLYYNHYRDYDPVTGRYIQADPLRLGGDVNPYVYALSNPMNVIDPTGEYGLPGGIIGGGGNLAYQLYNNGGRLGCVNWLEVAGWALTGSGLGAAV